VGPGSFWKGVENFSSTGTRSPDYLAHESAIPTAVSRPTLKYLYFSVQYIDYENAAFWDKMRVFFYYS
jgi:hypothetical protein